MMSYINYSNHIINPQKCSLISTYHNIGSSWVRKADIFKLHSAIKLVWLFSLLRSRIDQGFLQYRENHIRTHTYIQSVYVCVYHKSHDKLTTILSEKTMHSVRRERAEQMTTVASSSALKHYSHTLSIISKMAPAEPAAVSKFCRLGAACPRAKAPIRTEKNTYTERRVTQHCMCVWLTYCSDVTSLDLLDRD